MAMNVASRSSSSLAPDCFATAKRFLLQGSHPAISAHAYANSESVFLSSDPGVNRRPTNSCRARAPTAGSMCPFLPGNARTALPLPCVWDSLMRRDVNESRTRLSRKPRPPEGSALNPYAGGTSMLEVKASSRAFAFSVTSCRASVCRQVRVVAFPLLDCAVVNSIQSALIYPERLRGRRTMTAPLSTRRSLALGPRMSLASFAVALLMLPAWPSSARAASLEDIKKRGYMIVATEDDYPPFEFVVDGKPMGYDHELLSILRKSAGFEVRQEILPWQGILPGVASGKYDVALSAAVITDERVKSLDFTVPISESTMAYVKRKGDASIKSLKDLSGKTLGVQQGGASFQVLPELEVELKKTGGKLGNVVQYGAFSEAYQDLVNRRLDAVIHNIVSLSTLVSEKPDVFEFGQRVGRKSYAAWAVQKNNKSLVDFLNAFLAQQKSNGTYKQLQSKWLRIMFDDLPNQPLLPGDRPIK